MNNQTLKNLQEELRQLYPIEYIEKKYSEITDQEEIERLIRVKKSKILIEELRNCKPGNDDWREFEKMCKKLIKLTLEENEFNEAETQEQLPSKYVPLDEKGIRVDIVIPLVQKESTQNNSIWDEFRTEYHCKYLVIDAKNYNTEITDREIYQVFHYLNPDRGKIGIILSRKKNVDSSGKAALNRIKHDGYKIFVLTDKEVREWINAYSEKGEVRTFFRSLLTRYDYSFNS